MAPLPPTHRNTRPLKSVLKKPPQSSNPSSKKSDDFFPTSKKDKRHIKHAQLISRISKQNTNPKRRRPNKKLVTTLDSLADALPDETSAAAGPRPEEQVNIITRKSLKSRPGALKRKQKLDNEERARFSKNMAQMAATEPRGVGNEGSATQGATGRWSALRGFISQTLEKRDDVAAVTK